MAPWTTENTSLNRLSLGEKMPSRTLFSMASPLQRKVNTTTGISKATNHLTNNPRRWRSGASKPLSLDSGTSNITSLQKFGYLPKLLLSYHLIREWWYVALKRSSKLMDCLTLMLLAGFHPSHKTGKKCTKHG